MMIASTNKPAMRMRFTAYPLAVGLGSTNAVPQPFTGEGAAEQERYCTFTDI